MQSMNDIFIQDVSKEKDLTPEETHMLYLDSHTKTIKKHLGAVAESFIAIGFYLYEVRIYNYYEPKFKDVLEYAEDTFGLSKTSTYNFIALCEKFSKRTQRNTPYMYIDEKWKGYNISQLTEMLSMDDEDIEKVTPDMTVKRIRAIKKKEIEKSVPTSGKQIWTKKLSTKIGKKNMDTFMNKLVDYILNEEDLIKKIMDR